MMARIIGFPLFTLRYKLSNTLKENILDCNMFDAMGITYLWELKHSFK